MWSIYITMHVFTLNRYINTFICFSLYMCLYLLYFINCMLLRSSWSYGIWTYNYLCNRWISSLTLWIRIPLMTRCTRYNIMWKSLSVKYVRWVVFSWYSYIYTLPNIRKVLRFVKKTTWHFTIQVCTVFKILSLTIEMSLSLYFSHSTHNCHVSSKYQHISLVENVLIILDKFANKFFCITYFQYKSMSMILKIRCTVVFIWGQTATYTWDHPRLLLS